MRVRQELWIGVAKNKHIFDDKSIKSLTLYMLVVTKFQILEIFYCKSFKLKI